MVLVKHITVDEFEQFINLPKNSDRLFELIHGEIVEKVPTQEHGIIAVNFAATIFNYLKQNPIGRAAVEARHRPADDDENDRLPDVSFVSDKTKDIVTEGAVLAMPDLAVEIESPSDAPKKMLEKAQYYLAHGTRMVVLVYSKKRLVEVLTPNDRQLLTEDDVLDGGDVLPGFKLPIKDIFPD